METALPYLMSVIGFLIVFVLNGIKTEIRDIKGQLTKIEGDLHRRMSDVDRRHETQYVDLDRRITSVESKCAVRYEVQQ